MHIYRDVASFRSAADQVDWTSMPIQFQGFPRGVCGDISDILAEFLYELGYTNIDYICGFYGEQSHAWLEYENLVIDVTSDQFEESEILDLITPKDIWSSKFIEEDRRKAGYREFTGPAIPDLMRVHHQIKALVNA